ATLQIEEGVKTRKEDSFPHAGIIQREETSMEEDIKGCEVVAEDEVTQRFSSEELVWQLSVVRVIGILIWYLTTQNWKCIYGSIYFRVKCWLSNQVQMICAKLGVRCLCGLVHFHNRENRLQEGGICVANHASPLDVLILASDGCYSLVGQAHGGLLGLIQKSCMQTSQHVFFECSEMKDRHLVRKKEHIADKAKLPILIFLEVMMFEKGSFEVGGTIHPVAIKVMYLQFSKYVFWNSTKYSTMTYIFKMMTSWAIVCNVWYLPPMVKELFEDAVHFANRVKAVIAAQGGMSVLPWDGGLKRKKIKESFKEEQQNKYCQIVIESGTVGNGNVC
uniref:Phospholipid/glycerol acyltransferase domain-containing protein n=1 Tax=Buteo japonicus TaxID=224669 RepID=A0A8C0BG01_9AVES